MSSYFNHDFSISQHFNISVLGVVVRGAKNTMLMPNLEYFMAKELALLVL